MLFQTNMMQTFWVDGSMLEEGKGDGKNPQWINKEYLCEIVKKIAETKVEVKWANETNTTVVFTRDLIKGEKMSSERWCNLNTEETWRHKGFFV